MLMKKNIDILTNTAFWTSLAERYFEAETSEEEEKVLKCFVASEFSCDKAFGPESLELFEDVRVTMSIITVAKHTLSQTEGRKPAESKTLTPNQGVRKWKWVAAGVAAAVVGGVFFLLPSANDNPTDGDICLARVNGQLVTDRDEVISLMHDSWNDIDILSDGSQVVESQMKEMFNLLE